MGAGENVKWSQFRKGYAMSRTGNRLKMSVLSAGMIVAVPLPLAAQDQSKRKGSQASEPATREVEPGRGGFQDTSHKWASRRNNGKRFTASEANTSTRFPS